MTNLEDNIYRNINITASIVENKEIGIIPDEINVLLKFEYYYPILGKIYSYQWRLVDSRRVLVEKFMELIKEDEIKEVKND